MKKVFLTIFLSVGFIYLCIVAFSPAPHHVADAKYVEVVKVFALANAECDSSTNLEIRGNYITKQIVLRKNGDPDLKKLISKCNVPNPELQNLSVFKYITVKTGKDTWDVQNFGDSTWETIKIGTKCALVGGYVDFSNCNQN